MTEETELAVRRILVALDESEGGAAALEAAVLLGALLRVELEAVFVEDLNLLRLAGLPFAREVLGVSATERRLDQLAMERALRTQAERLRRRLEARLAAVDVRWSFSVVRGNVSRELLSRTTAADLLVLGRTARLTAGRVPALGSTARAVLGAVGCAVLVAQAGTAPEHPVVALFDGSDAATRALRIAARLARKDGDGLLILTPEAAGKELQDRAREIAAAAGIAPRLQSIPGAEPTHLAAALRRADGRILVAAAVHAEERERLCAALSCPVLLVP